MQMNLWKFLKWLMSFKLVARTPHTIRRTGRRRGKMRNKPCWCGSGWKYKKCHYQKDERSGREYW
jgi:uncharacterized protein YecA (UPF0149 family)